MTVAELMSSPLKNAGEKNPAVATAEPDAARPIRVQNVAPTVFETFGVQSTRFLGRSRGCVEFGAVPGADLCHILSKRVIFARKRAMISEA
jgi:hypothetical protein